MGQEIEIEEIIVEKKADIAEIAEIAIIIKEKTIMEEEAQIEERKI